MNRRIEKILIAVAWLWAMVGWPVWLHSVEVGTGITLLLCACLAFWAIGLDKPPVGKDGGDGENA